MPDLFIHIKTTVADKAEGAGYVKSLQSLLAGAYDNLLYEFKDYITDADLTSAQPDVKIPIK